MPVSPNRADKVYGFAGSITRSLFRLLSAVMVARFGGAPTYAVYVLCITIEAVLLAVPNAVNLAPMLSIGPGLPDSYRESFLGRMQRRHVRCSLLVAGLGVVAACGLVAQSPGAWTWCAFALALLTTGVLNGVRSLQQARFCSRLVFWADLLGMTVPLLVVCWSYQLGVDNLLASYFAAIAIGAGGAAWLLHRQQPEGGEVPQEVLQRCRQMGPAMAVGSLANSACSRVQPFVLQSAAGVAAVGGFGVIQTAIGPMRLLATALCSVVRPRLALHAGRAQEAEAWSVLTQVAMALAGGGAVLVLLAAVFGDWLVLGAFGPEFASVATLLPLAFVFAALEATAAIMVVALQTLCPRGAATATRLRIAVGGLALVMVGPACYYASIAGAFSALCATELLFLVLAYVAVQRSRQHFMATV